MSFDLAVWHETAPISAIEAEQTYERICDVWGNPDAAHPSVAAFLAELTAMPVDVVGAELIEWDGLVHNTEHGAVIHIMWSASRSGGKVVRELAERHGLVCFDPQVGIVLPNAPGYIAAFTLTNADGDTYPDPSANRIDRVARKLSRDNHFVILERADGWFAQAGYGEDVGVRPGTYAMEYQEGSLDQQFRTETSDLNNVIRFLTEFLSGQDSWKRRQTWHHLEL